MGFGFRRFQTKAEIHIASVLSNYHRSAQTASNMWCWPGNRAGVVDLAYSDSYRFLLSASIDHEVGVWSPFADRLVFKLIGHGAPLIGVQFVQGTPQIVSADVQG